MIVFIGLCGFLATVFIIVCPIAYFCSLDTYGNLIAAQKLVPQYEKAIAETKLAVVELNNGDSTIEISEGLANLKHSTLTAERIAEMRNYLKYYYETLERYRLYKSIWFCRRFIADMPAVLLEE